ncbi:MAG: sigma-54-dependent Fis family transcriptional regulator [Bdellovibrionaceae bacterium]|nr:sigma-54-dependent Fis family transcriptional regulator [Pseudobdellovibrionaceae bacterium]
MSDNQNYKILIIDDESAIREVLSASLKDEGYNVSTAHDGASGLQALKTFNPDIVFLDIWMPGDMDGMQVLSHARRDFPLVDFVMISGHGTIETAVKATKLGAYDFVEKPLSMDKISITIANILNYQQEKEEKILLLNKLRKSIALIGEAPAIMATKQIIAKMAPTQSWIMVSGETGVGKALAAQNIHYMSTRAGKPFVDINCGAIPEDLLEGEIFGIDKGAMPGVDKIRKGKLDLAQGGTLFLNEVSALTPEVQHRLVKFYETKNYYRVGGSEEIHNDVRIIATTTRDIEKMVKEGKFSEDLYYKLNIIPFRIPTLRDRPEDIPVLTSFFSDHVAREGGYMKKQFSEQAMKAMGKYEWPGNIRELRNFVERIYILTPGEFVDLHDVRFAGLSGKEGERIDQDAMSTFREARAQFEKEYLLKKIAENGGNISKTAEVIGLERSYLHRKIKSYGIEVP